MSVIEVGYTQPGGANGGADWINVKNFGAKGNGSHDDTTAIQNAINACTGNANPATTTRTPTAALYFPAGTYKVTSDLIIRSVSGFTVKTDGPNITRLNASGTNFTNAVLFIDGSLDGVYAGFTITGDGTEQVTDAIRLDWTTSAARSTSANMFRDIRVRNLKTVVGISLEGNGTRQVDGTVLENVVLTGSQTANAWSTSGNWQKGIAFGNGSFGNNYDHVLTGVSASGYYYGYYNNVSSFALFGAQPAGNFCDFWISPCAQTTVTNVQSQNSGQLLITPATFSPIPNSFSDVSFKTSFLQGSGNAFMTLGGGTWNFNNVNATNLLVSGSYVNGTISITGTASTRPCVCNFNNLSVFNTRTSCFTVLTNAIITVQGYSNYSPTTGLFTYAAGDVSSFNQGGTWNNAGGVTLPQVTFMTATGTYTQPVGAQVFDVTVVAGASGGGSGAFATSGNAGGGSGGGTGGYSRAQFQASQLANSFTVTIGTGGVGGAAVTVPGAGNVGTVGNSTLFGSYLWAHGSVTAGGGAGNATNAAAVAGGVAGAIGFIPGFAGAATVTTAAAPGPAAGNVTGGGGAGGGVSGTPQNGSGCTATLAGANANVSTGGVVGGALPTNGSAVIQGDTAPGGGGGAAATSGAAQNGADGQANTGAAGGGGGACSGGTSSGAGGHGGSGFALIIAYFQ